MQYSYGDEANLVKVSVVVIGLNEGSRLRSCLELIFTSELKPVEVIYVDSGSTDQSVEIAKSVPGVRVFVLDTNTPSPGMGRNVGLSQCCGDYVQFVDGDMLLAPDWLGRGIEVIRKSDDLCCICGHVVEEEKKRSLFEDILSIDWESKLIGEVQAPGGGGLFHREKLIELGGYRNDLIAAEETELGARIIENGYKINRLPAPMCKHKLGISRFSQFWTRAKRSGCSRMQILRHSRSEHKWDTFRAPTFSIGSMLIFAIAIIIKNPMLIFLWIGMLSIMSFRIGHRYYRLTKQFNRSMLFGFLNYVGMLPWTHGFIYEFFSHRVTCVEEKIYFSELSDKGSLIKRSVPNNDIRINLSK